MSDQIESIHLHVPEADLDDLRARLSRVRWPEGRTVSDTSQGSSPEKLTALIEHWRDRYDWRACETLINSLGQYRTTIQCTAARWPRTGESASPSEQAASSAATSEPVSNPGFPKTSSDESSAGSSPPLALTTPGRRPKVDRVFHSSRLTISTSRCTVRMPSPARVR